MKGWIKIHRSLIEWDWYTDANAMRLFIHCLLKANHEDKKWKGEVIKRGTFVTSLSIISSELGMSQKQVRGAISKLERTNELAKKGRSQNTIIQVVNYDKYQEEGKQEGKRREQRGANEGQTEGKRGATTKNNKNNKNDKNIDNINIPHKSEDFQKNESVHFCRSMNDVIVKFDSLGDLSSFYRYITSTGEKCTVKDIENALKAFFAKLEAEGTYERDFRDIRKHFNNYALGLIKQKNKENEKRNSKKSAKQRSDESYKRVANEIINTNPDDLF